MDVYELTASDDPQQAVDRIGRDRTIYLIPSGEPQTAEIEQRVVETFSAIQGDGYFTIKAGRS
jgi:hypothetical protein